MMCLLDMLSVEMYNVSFDTCVSPPARVTWNREV